MQAGRLGSQVDGTSYAPSAFSLEDFPGQASQGDGASQADSDAGFLAFAGGAYQTQQGLATQVRPFWGSRCQPLTLPAGRQRCMGAHACGLGLCTAACSCRG